MIIATGGQGEPRARSPGSPSTATRSSSIAGDMVIFSSKQIPGNEIAIGRIQNQLAAKGVEMVTDRQAACPCLRPSRPARARGDV